MKKSLPAKRNYSGLTLRDAMKLIPAEQFHRWQLSTPPRPPSDFLMEDLRRLESFDLKSSEQAKTLLIDSLLSEIVPLHGSLKVWKAAVLNTDELTGVADYLMAPRRAYLETPLLCVAEAKRDDFEQGTAQCIAEMVGCQRNNRQEGHDIDVFGIVSNGPTWQFYKLTRAGEIFERSCTRRRSFRNCSARSITFAASAPPTFRLESARPVGDAPHAIMVHGLATFRRRTRPNLVRLPGVICAGQQAYALAALRLGRYARLL